MTLFWPVARVVETGSLCGAGVRKKKKKQYNPNPKGNTRKRE